MRYVAVSLFALGLAATNTAPAEELTEDQIKLYAATSGYVLSAQRWIEEVSDACGSSAPRLSEIWNERNATAVMRADTARALVHREIENAIGADTAAVFAKQQDDYLAEKISARAREVSALPERQKEAFCRDFLESTIRGRWDMVLPEQFDLVQIPLEDSETVVAVTASSSSWRYGLTHEQTALEDIKEQIYLPVGEKIRFVVQSVDVIHSMRFEDSEQGSIDAIPGVKNERNVVFDQTGIVTVRCGESHAESDRVFIKINVVEREEFLRWLRGGR